MNKKNKRGPESEEPIGAESVNEEPRIICFVVSLSTTPVSATPRTVTVHDVLSPDIELTVTTAVPSLTPVMMPFSTLTTLLLLLFHSRVDVS